jgi:hypothetical protein
MKEGEIMIKTMTEGKARVLIASALALLSQGAWSDDGQAAREAVADITVSIPNQRIEIAAEKIEASASAHIEALNRRIAQDLAESLEAISNTRFELAIAEVPTRG